MPVLEQVTRLQIDLSSGGSAWLDLDRLRFEVMLFSLIPRRVTPTLRSQERK